MAAGLDVIGDRWVLLILRDVFLGRSRFEELRLHTGASRTTLTRRLCALLDADVLYKRSYSNSGNRFEYKLTEKGLGLFSSSLLAWQWELEWSEQAGDVLPLSLFHNSCDHVLTPTAVCRHCQQALNVNDVQWPEISTGLEGQMGEIQSFSKRRVRNSNKSGQEDLSLATVSDLIGDRWTLLLLICTFLGIKRYDEFLKRLKIASNILIQRLNLLVEVNILKRIEYQENPPRSEYQLTKKGKSLFPLVMTMRQWVIDYLPKENNQETLIHKNCGHALSVEVLCIDCRHRPWPRDVGFNKS
jgi:DNA-binding HxlR family transcriptional regulator